MKTKQNAFTLIEVLVAAGIILILVGLGIANYIRFNDRQKIRQAHELLRQAVSDAQNSARNGKLRGCQQLQAYQVELNPTSISIEPVCSDDDDVPITRVFDLPAGVIFENGSLFYIRPITGRVYGDSDFNHTGPFTINLQLEDKSFEQTVVLDHSGAVEQYQD